MLTPPRFVVIDDDAKHLEAIVSTMQSLGSACAKIHYTSVRDPDRELFKTVRAIFMDLQLLNRSATSDFRQHYAEIQRILDLVIHVEGGPYLLVVWTDMPNRVVELRQYLERFFARKPFVRPVAILPLSKTRYINSATGEATSRDLVEEIRTHLRKHPAMNSLVQWETDVLGAAARVLADISTLACELEGETSLPTLLKRLANEAVGHKNAGEDPRAAVQAALLPMLQDHLKNSNVVAADWADPFDGAVDPAPPLSKSQVALLNNRLHITNQNTDRPISPLAWGAVCEIEEEIDWNELGLESEEHYVREIVATNVRIDLKKSSEIEVVQIRIGAACDYAQKACGPIPYALAAVLPGKQGLKAHALHSNSTGWISPEVDLGNGVVQLFVEPRFVRVRGETSAASFEVISRIGEQLLLELVSTVSHHGSRPGIFRFVSR